MEDFADMSAVPLSESFGLRNVANNKTLYLKLLKMFIAQYSNSYEELCTAVKSNNMKEAQELNHKIKGVALNLGILHLGELTKSIDIALKNGEDLSLYLELFEKSLAISINAINSYLESE